MANPNHDGCKPTSRLFSVLKSPPQEMNVISQKCFFLLFAIARNQVDNNLFVEWMSQQLHYTNNRYKTHLLHTPVIYWELINQSTLCIDNLKIVNISAGLSLFEQNLLYAAAAAQW